MSLKNPVAIFSPIVHRAIGDENSPNGPVLLDIVLRARERLIGNLTEHPIEVSNVGTTVAGRVADHFYIDPVRYEMSGAVANHSVRWAEFNEYGNSQNQTRSQGAYNLLRELFYSGEPFQLVTRFTRLDNMVITELDIPETKRTANAFFFDATLQEALVVSSSTVSRNRLAENMEGDQAQTGAILTLDQGAAIPTEPNALDIQRIGEFLA